MTSNIFNQKQNFFDRWAPNYDIIFTTIFYQSLHKRLLDYVELPENPYILDLGCGTGRLLHRFANEFPNLKGIGLDLSAEMLRQARLRNQHRERVIYKQGNAESMPFAEGQFDGVFNTISFLHYPNPQEVFMEVSRVLRVGGRFHLVDYKGRDENGINFIPFSPNGIRFYPPSRREEFGRVAGLRCVGHYYLLGWVMLSVFVK